MKRKIEHIIVSPLTTAIIVYVNTGEISDEYRKQYEKTFHRELPSPEEIKKLHKLTTR